jgi:putative GTP pyrophosphokinase
MNSYTKILLNDFENKYQLYEEFCAAVYKLLGNLLNQKGYKHQILCRVKTLSRLKEKIIRKEKEGKIYKKLSDIEDLVGIRVVFYLESDKKRFIKDIRKEIKSPIRLEKHEKVLGYRAEHLIATLDPTRLRLSEYKRFKSLKCEIQITSILNHAWAEIEHDWLYKDIYGFKSKNPEKYNFLKKKMEYIFNNYVKKTGLAFEKIAKQIKQYSLPQKPL